MGRYLMIGGGHWIDEIKDGGKIIVLEDGSCWEISPIDIVDTSIWLSVTDISVEDGADPNYPYKLINTDDKEEVDAKYLGTK